MQIVISHYSSVPQHPCTVVYPDLAYKADVDDTRGSPAIKVVELLRAEGFEVRAYDPYVPMGTMSGQVDSLEEAAVVMVLTDHDTFRELGPEVMNGFGSRAVLDTRNTLRGLS